MVIIHFVRKKKVFAIHLYLDPNQVIKKQCALGSFWYMTGLTLADHLLTKTTYFTKAEYLNETQTLQAWKESWYLTLYVKTTKCFLYREGFNNSYFCLTVKQETFEYMFRSQLYHLIITKLSFCYVL